MSVSFVLDAGALIALDRHGTRVTTWLAEAQHRGASMICPAGALAQAWRAGDRQANLARLLKHPRTFIVALDGRAARRIGILAAYTGATDVVDLSVALTARDHDAVVVTSDPLDIAAIDPSLVLIAV